MPPQSYNNPNDPARHLQRVLAIHRRLSAGKTLRKKQLADEFGVNERTIRRDFDALRDEGAPLRYFPGKGHRYTEAGWSFTGFQLTPHEQFALMVAEQALAQYEGLEVYEDLRRGFERILAKLPGEVREAQADVAEAIHFGGLPQPRIDPDHWELLLTAVRARHAVRLTYQPLEGAPAERVVHPYQLLARERDWFLVAHRPDKKRELLYYLPRVRRVMPLLDQTFEVHNGFDREAFHRQGFNAMQGPSEPVTVRLHFAPGAAMLAEERPWSPDQKLNVHEDGAATISFQSAALFEIKRQVLRYEGRVQVLEPAELRQDLAATAQELAALHAS